MSNGVLATSDPELELEKMETFDISIDQDANGDWWWNATGVRNGSFASEGEALRDFETRTLGPDGKIELNDRH